MKTPWLGILGGLVAAGLLAAALTLGLDSPEPPARRFSTAVKSTPFNPLAGRSKPHLDHSAFFPDSLGSGPEVTRRCLECHKDAAAHVMRTAHWTWLSGDVERGGQTVRIGKKNLLNNFCISITGNWARCTKCHAGYGWVDENFDFALEENVDCLVCHDGSGQYHKDEGGVPAPDVDLRAAAGSVRMPRRENCGACHFNGGGGMGVKHGDMDDALLNPSDQVDVHMGRLGFDCVDCHTSENHRIAGKLNTTYSDTSGVRHLSCDGCHGTTPHEDARLNQHVARVACQTCHIPAFARKYATKMDWDWSQAGDGARKEDEHAYLRIKGAFVYRDQVRPEYFWFNGRMDRYILGDKLDSLDQAMNQPRGHRRDPAAKIWPFKVHRARQLFDPVNRTLIPPLTAGEGGFWTTFDWPSAARLGAEASGLPYSGSFDFTQTHMFWPINHMTAPADQALTCTECHAPEGRLDWQALGYDGDPVGGTRHAR